MKKWQKDRNYKRVKDKDGNVVANIITVFGQDVEVSDEIFTAYMQMDNHARYIMEDAPKGKELSLEQMMEDGTPVETTVYDAVLSAEECYLQAEEVMNEVKMLDELPLAIKSLSESDRKLIKALYYDGCSTRECARELGITQTAMIKRRNRILKHLKNYFEKF